jgi:Flp pilus assembly protein TadD
LLLLRRDGHAAAKWARRAVEIDPKSERAQGLLGDALVRMGEVEGAREAWFKAAGIDGDETVDVSAMTQRDLREAALSAEKRDYTRAERFYRRVLAFAPDSMPAALGLGLALLRLGDVQPAANWAQRATELDDTSTEARVVYGDALMKLGRNEEAKMQWQEAMLLDPANRDARKRLRNLE